jgi:putative oxidoreductase
MTTQTNIATEANRPGWTTAAVLAGRLIFASVFIMAVSFKLMNISATADYIASAGFPAPSLLAWLAASLELALIASFLTGAYFSEAALLAAAYVLFLGFAFHGPSRWAANQAEFGFFVDHFTFIAGLFFAAAHGPGRVLAVKRGWIIRRSRQPAASPVASPESKRASVTAARL